MFWSKLINFSSRGSFSPRAGLRWRMAAFRVYLLCSVVFLCVVSSTCEEFGMGAGLVGSHIVTKTSCSSFFFNSQVNNAQVSVLLHMSYLSTHLGIQNLIKFLFQVSAGRCL